MEIPQPPQDEELKNIIQKLAVFVARNGPEFEMMTKQKQQGNPQFAFLFGGEFYNYYMYRVTTEQAVLKHKAAIQQRHGEGGMGGGPSYHQGHFSQGGGYNNQQQQPPQLQMHGQQQQQQQQARFGSPMLEQPGGQSHNMSNVQGGQIRHGHVSRFDRGPSGQHMYRFERPPMAQPFNQSHNFENFGSDQGGNFDRGGPGGFQYNHPGPRPPSARGFEPRGPPQVHPRAFQMGDRGPHMFDERPPSVPSHKELTGDFDMRGRGTDIISGGIEPFETRKELPPQSFSQNFFPPMHQSQSSNNLPLPPGHISSSMSSVISPAKLNADIESVKAQKASLEEQIKQSEQNLAAQHQVLMAQQQEQIDESIRLIQDVEIKQLANELNIDLKEFDDVLQPIIENCTKDSISGGKAWIFTHTSTPRHYQLLSLYLLRQTTDPGASFNKRLHVIYLVNDVLHHCMRKGAEDLQLVLEAMVIPMFSHAKVKEMGNEENLSKLNKLLTLWENKNQYVSSVAVEKLRDTNNTWLEYHSELLKRHSVIVSQIAQNIQKTYEGYQSQHQMFCQHVAASVKALDQQLQPLLIQQQIQQQQQVQQQNSQLPFGNTPGSLGHGGSLLPLPVSGIQNIPPPGVSHNGSSQPSLLGLPSTGLNVPYMTTGYPNSGESSGGPPGPGFVHQSVSNQATTPGENSSIPLDISRPPPGFPPPVSEKELTPALPYYELPAGLMVPLVKPEDDNYKPVDPKAIRLPPPCPPSERLLQAVEAFYGPPSHERPRDSEGWERLGLYEYFKSKNLARKQKEDDIREGRRDKSKSPSPIRRDSSPSGRSPPRRRYQSKSPTQMKRRRSHSRSPSASRRKSSRRRSRSRSRSPKRSPTPPSFGMPGLGIDRKLDESNKGHQLLKKMGWGGSGLGANEQGISNPISGGEIREKKDLYKGVGISMNDPFESYRKSKGQAFVERMRQRAEERP